MSVGKDVVIFDAVKQDDLVPTIGRYLAGSSTELEGYVCFWFHLSRHVFILPVLIPGDLPNAVNIPKPHLFYPFIPVNNSQASRYLAAVLSTTS
jgi:hypothetical protein